MRPVETAFAGLLIVTVLTTVVKVAVILL